MERSSIPISVIALGKLAWDGSQHDLSLRVLRTGDRYVIDHLAHYAECRIGSQPAWVRIPALPTVEQRYIGQINSRGVSNAGLFALHDPGSGKVFELTEPPADTSLSDLDPKELDQVEDLFRSEDLDRFEEALRRFNSQAPSHPRIVFNLGVLALHQGDPLRAKQLFHRALELGHPDGLTAELAATNILAKPFREKHPQIFEHLKRGEPARALTLLRYVREEDPLNANAILAYCLRGTSEIEEGLLACLTALEHDPLQPDVLGHQWSYLTQLERDHDALAVAQTHLRLYPTHSLAYIDALDSALLSADLDRARWYAFGYLLHAENYNIALRHLFKYLEHTRDWQNAREVFEDILPTLRAPTPETLVDYGEILAELHDYASAFPVLERAMMAAPEQAYVVLANGRALARSGDIEGAIRFMNTVMNDPNRNDSIPDRFLMLAFLSELFRNNGELEKALGLWPNLPSDFVDAIGPRPLVEYTYCLAEKGDLDGAQAVLKALQSKFSGLYIVDELTQKLRDFSANL